MSRAFRQAQADSLAGRHTAAAKGFARARKLAPDLPHLALQEALAEARAGRPESGLRLVRAAKGVTPPYRWIEGWLLARAGRPADGLAVLRQVHQDVPANRVVATALAYAHLRAGDRRAAMLLLADAGDNLEVLSWAWAELERTKPPLRVTELAPLPDDPKASARRLLKSGQAADAGHLQAVVRRSLLTRRWARWLRPLLAALERRWPTDSLTAYRRGAHADPELPVAQLHAGAALVESGHPDLGLEALATAAKWFGDQRAGGRQADDPAAGNETWWASEEAWLLHLARATALGDLGRWVECQAELDELITEGGAQPADNARVHEFAAPEWHGLRGRCRIASGDFDAGRADLEQALVGEPTLFEARLRRLA